MLAAVLILNTMFALLQQGQPTPVPQPFPRPGTSQPAAPRPAPLPPTTAPAPAVPTPPPASATPPPAAAPDGEAPPTDATLGIPVYPAAQFIASYSAGRGQRYYLFGCTAPFADVVAYYRTTLKQRGTLVFESPATHTFETTKFDELTMAFPPGVTVKDFLSDVSRGYPNKPGAQPERFPTVIQIVPGGTR